MSYARQMLDTFSRTVDVDATLAMLVGAEFIEPQREGWAAPQERFKFRHALMRDAAYSLLTEDHRILSHRLACAHLEQSGGADPAVQFDDERAIVRIEPLMLDQALPRGRGDLQLWALHGPDFGEKAVILHRHRPV